VVAAALVVAGCAAGPGGGGEATARNPKGAEVSDISADQEAFLNLAEDELVSRCMAKKGFKYTVAPPLTPESLPDAPYGSDDLAYAREHGFGSVQRRDRSERVEKYAREDPNKRHLDSLSPRERDRYWEAFAGDLAHQAYVTLPDGTTVSVATKGCVAEARTQLYGNLSEWLRLDHTRQAFVRDVRSRVESDAQFGRAVAAWRDCMQGRGLRYASPAAASEPFLGAATANLADNLADKPSAKEVRVAVAAAECSRESKLTETGERLERELRLAGSAEYDRAVLAWHELQLRALQRARSLLGLR
jgi:hypothetical protein